MPAGIRTGNSGFMLNTNLMNFLEGLYDMGVLVFLLVFTIVFAILQKTNILGHGKKNFNVAVALVMGLLVMVPHITGDYPVNYDVVDIINNALPDISLLAVASIMLLLLIGVFGAESRWMGASLSGWMAIIAFVFIVVIFGSAAGFVGPSFDIYDYVDADTLTLMVIILVFAIIVWYITRDDTQVEGLARTGNVLEELGNFFGGKR